MSRRQLQIALGVLWLLDGILQAQSLMFTRGFATQVIAPSGQGQPGFVAAPVHRVATIVGAHPVAWNVPFAALQLLLGVGLLVERIARMALAASIAWALGVWYLGPRDAQVGSPSPMGANRAPYLISSGVPTGVSA